MKKLRNLLLGVILAFTFVSNTMCVNYIKAEDSNDLTQFITNVSIKDSNNNEVNELYKSETYNISISFAESGESGGAEMNTPTASDSTLTYTLPSSLSAVTTEGTIAINVNGNYVNATYTISNNVVTVTIPHDAEHYNELASASNLQFEIKLQAKLSDGASSGEIKFGNITKTVTVKEDTPTLTLTKGEPSYDKTTGTMTYTVYAKASGHPTNVVITDAISGTALTFDDSTFSVKSDKNESISQTFTKDTNGFTYNVSEMSNGETLTFTYKAKVDYSKLGSDSTKFTAEMTNNTLSAKVDGTDQTSASSTYTKEAYTAVSKSNAGTSTTGNTQTTTWKIKVNEDCIVSMAGKEITDTLTAPNNATTKYAGEGITVTKYTKGSTTATSTETKTWNELGVTSDSSTEFKYTLPTESGSTIYWYEITYTTETDISSLIANTSITNTAKAIDQSSSASADITVGENGKWSVSKTHDSTTLTKDNVDYTVTVNVPKNGFSSLTITDTLPYSESWVNNSLKFYSDELKIDTVVVKIGDTTLTKDSDYTITYTEPKVENNTSTKAQLKIEISSSAISSYFGRSTEDRTLTITYSTNPSDEWGSNKTRTNNVSVTADGSSKSATDSYVLVEQSFNKVADTYQTQYYSHLDNKKYDGFKFYVTLSGVDSDSVSFTDAYNKNLFTLKVVNIGAIDESNAIAWTESGGGTLTSEEVTSTGSTVTFVPKKKDDGTYYGIYKVTYLLMVKDENAWNTIKNAANSNENGKYTIENTAKWNDLESKATFDYSYEPLTKSFTKVDENTEKYTVVINKDALTLNNNTNYTVTDKLSIDTGKGSVTYDTSSFKFKVDGTVTEDLSATFTSNLMSFRVEVPDGKKIEITYDVKISGGSALTYSNSLSALGKYSEKVNGGEFKGSESGSASTYSFTIQKLDKDTQEPVAGAVYELYHLESDGTYKALTNKSGENITFTSDADGKAELKSQNSTEAGWTLYGNSTYKLVEKTAPAGYSIGEDKVFTIATSSTEATEDKGELVYQNAIIRVYDAKQDETTLTTDLTLSVKKTVTVDSTSNTASDKKTFSFELYKADESFNAENTALDTETVTVSSVTAGSSSENNSVSFNKIESLEEGTYYYAIKEVSDANATNWTYDNTVYNVKVVIAKNEAGDALTKTITVNDYVTTDPTVTFTNTYKSEKDTGNLVITKTINGPVTKDEAEGAISFKVTNTSTSTSNTYKLTDTNAKYENGVWTITLSGIEVGTYSIEETVTDINGKVLASTTYKVNNATDSTNGTKVNSVSITKDTTTTVAYENNYKAKVKISKVDATSKEELAGAQLTITDKDGKTVESWTSTKDKHEVSLEAGTYTLTETTAPNGYRKAESIEFTVTETGKVTVDGKEAAVNTVTMEDAHTEGKLVITKTIEGAVTEEEAKGAISFKVTDPDKKEITYTLKNVTPVDGVYTIEIDHAKVGNYKVEEVVKDITGKTLASTSYTIGEVTNTGKEASTSVVDNETTTVAYKNTYTTDKGILVITKTIEGDVTKEEAKGAISFKVTDSNNNSMTYTLAQNGELGDDGKWTITINDVVAGEYTVEEVVKDINGKTLASVQYTIGDSEVATSSDTASVTVSKNATTSVNYQNIYETVYSFTLKKMDSANHSIALEGATYQLYQIVNGKEKALKWKDGTDVTFTTGKDGTVKMSDENAPEWGSENYWKFEAGNTYKLVEINAPDGYELGDSREFTLPSASPDSSYSSKIRKISRNVVKGDVKNGETIEVFDAKPTTPKEEEPKVPSTPSVPERYVVVKTSSK